MEYSREKDLKERANEYRRLGWAKGISAWKTRKGKDRFRASIGVGGGQKTCPTVRTLDEVIADRLDLELKYGIDKREEWIRHHWDSRWDLSAARLAEYRALGHVRGIRSRETATKGTKFHAYVAIKKGRGTEIINGVTLSLVEDAILCLLQLEEQYGIDYGVDHAKY